MHPNHPELADVTCGALLGRGVALKRSPRYSSDADTCAVISGLCGAANIPLQTYMNRADLPGGSTVGSMASSLLAMPAADIGVPILADALRPRADGRRRSGCVRPPVHGILFCKVRYKIRYVTAPPDGESHRAVFLRWVL